MCNAQATTEFIEINNRHAFIDVWVKDGILFQPNHECDRDSIDFRILVEGSTEIQVQDAIKSLTTQAPNVKTTRTYIHRAKRTNINLLPDDIQSIHQDYQKNAMSHNVIWKPVHMDMEFKGMSHCIDFRPTYCKCNTSMVNILLFAIFGQTTFSNECTEYVKLLIECDDENYLITRSHNSVKM